MGIDEGNLQVKDVEVILEKLSNSIVLYGTYFPVAIMMFVIHIISYICDNTSKR